MAEFDYDALVKKYYDEEEIVIEILKVFLEKTDGLISEILVNIENNDFEAIKFNAHTIKGSSLNINCENIGNAALELELASKENNIEKCKEKYDKLKQLYNENRHAIEEKIK